ncbi:MAG: hypothetical protein ACP5OS_02315 [Leptospirillia bacterium]
MIGYSGKNFVVGASPAGIQRIFAPFPFYVSKHHHPGDLRFMPAPYRRNLVASDLSPLPEDMPQQMRSISGPKGLDSPEELHPAFVLKEPSRCQKLVHEALEDVSGEALRPLAASPTVMAA